LFRSGLYGVSINSWEKSIVRISHHHHGDCFSTEGKKSCKRLNSEKQENFVVKWQKPLKNRATKRVNELLFA
jgi:hypothetical protein